MSLMASTKKKLVAVGDAGSGKNSLLFVFSRKKDFADQIPIGSNYEVVDVEVGGQNVVLNLWSTSGEKFEKLTRLVWWSFKI